MNGEVKKEMDGTHEMPPLVLEENRIYLGSLPTAPTPYTVVASNKDWHQTAQLLVDCWQENGRFYIKTIEYKATSNGRESGNVWLGQSTYTSGRPTPLWNAEVLKAGKQDDKWHSLVESNDVPISGDEMEFYFHYVYDRGMGGDPTLWGSAWFKKPF